MSATTACIATMLEAWNTPDPAALRTLAAAALTADAEFVDPHNDIRGVDAFVAMVEAFQRKYAGARIARTSGIDLHHDRARYAWSVTLADGRRLDGFDAVALDLAQGRVRRIDGFFGPLPAL
ncbi:MAG: nuclear transport factor 2 family protein [Hyphomonadaceae bacterium]|nr:nuclear transport factor 2 family protein [Hyphomonadaceae bacterium]